MNNQPDNKLKEQKRKIFGQELRTKTQEKNGAEGSATKRALQIDSSHNSLSNSVYQQKSQLTELQSNNQQLKLLLKQQRERYDQLFEQYEDLLQKNSLIEKQYINLKYQHSKELKDQKKYLSEKFTQLIDKHVQEIGNMMREEKIGESLRSKVEKLVQKLRVLAVGVTSSRIRERGSKKEMDDGEDKVKSSFLLQKQESQQKKRQSVELEPLPLAQRQEKNESLQTQAPPAVKLSDSPQKQPRPVSLSLPIELFVPQPLFQDQHYGQLQDFSHYQQKIMQRRNYQLMKKSNRCTTDIKRKKIFNSIAGGPGPMG